MFKPEEAKALDSKRMLEIGGFYGIFILMERA